MTLVERSRAERRNAKQAQLGPEFSAKLYDGVHHVRCEALRRILRHGFALGQFRQDIDEDALAHVIHGAFWYRFLSGTKHPYDDTYARNVVALLRPKIEAQP